MALSERVRCAGHTAEPVGRFAAKKLILELGENVLLQASLFRVIARYSLDKPQGKLLVHIVIFQPSRSHERAILTDQGEFPSPSGVATFTDREKARAELNRLVTEEKENMEIPFSKELYREEYGNDFWEAYRDGYAAGWFTRYEIIESPLYAENIEEKGGAADDAAKTDLR